MTTAVARLIWLVLAGALVGCAQPPQAELPSVRAHTVDELWQEPTDLSTRDLFLGPGDQSLAPPREGDAFEFLALKTAGTNPGYDVRDQSGRIWSVKLGIEAQPEVTSSRILWAMGYHRPPLYFLRQFTLTGTDAGIKTTARFRTEPDHWKSSGEWSWYDNPFINTPAFRGLIVAQLILNNWDLKTTNNRIYEPTTPLTTAGRVYMVRDLGASLGWSRQFLPNKLLRVAGDQGTKNDIDGFERQGFIARVEGSRIDFDYRGMHQGLVDRLEPADVVWACERLAPLSDSQWQAAFRAGGYAPPIAERYITKIKQKIAQGFALKPTS